MALISSILLVWIVVLVLVYRAAQHEVEEVFDADLSRSARILQTLLLHEVSEEREMQEKVRAAIDELGSDGMDRYPTLSANLRGYLEDQVQERLDLVGTAQRAGQRFGGGLIFVARYADGSVMVRDKDGPDIQMTQPGFVDLSVDGGQWRIYRESDPESGFTVQVGERQAFRDELVRYITRNTLTPLLLALPVLALLIWIVVGRALSPLQRLADQVGKRAPGALEPVDARHAPQEILSLVAAINDLFGRVRLTFEREHQFTADAAHELRTPLAAIKTHLQVAHARTLDNRTQHSVDQALDGVGRASHLVEQLLLLARADADQIGGMLNAEVDLHRVAVSCVSLLSQLAIEHDIDLGMDSAGPVIVRGDADSLLLALRNLVDNAIRYTPAGGMVTVTVGKTSDRGWCCVSDNGPGVNAADAERIFDRFHRGTGEQAAGITGSGVGLSIVRRIADLHCAELTLGEGLDGRGLRVKMLFPAV